MNTYPVMITEEEIKNSTGIDLGSELKGQSAVKISNFLDTVHGAVYDYLIYTTGAKEVKNALITAFLTDLEADIKKALMLQLRYLIVNQSNIGMWNGIVKIATDVEVKDIQDIMARIVPPEVFNVLHSTRPNLLYAGS